MFFSPPISPVEKGQKWPGGRSRACPKCFCSLLFTWMCTLILWIIQTYYFTGTTCHPNILRNCNKSFDIHDFYLSAPGCRTVCILLGRLMPARLPACLPAHLKLNWDIDIQHSPAAHGPICYPWDGFMVVTVKVVHVVVVVSQGIPAKLTTF